MVTIVNIIGLVVGASILTMMLVNLYVPGFAIDALLAKGMIYFFGHVFINATIYMAVIAVYEILPRYTQRPWKSNKVFLASWTASTLMVLFIFPHHLLMDFRLSEMVADHGPGHRLPEYLPDPGGDRLRRPDDRVPLGHPLGHGLQAAVRLAVRLGGGRHAGVHRRHHHGQLRDAQHAVGAGPLPYLSAARHGGDGLRLHVLHRQAEPGGRGQLPRPRCVLGIHRRRRSASS